MERTQYSLVNEQPNKRPLENADPESASKRGRYVLNACENCRKRKVKCDGKLPCQKCLAQPVECVYRPTGPSTTGNATHDEQLQRLGMQVQALQDKLDSLLQGFEAVTTAQPRALEQPTGARCLQDDHEITVDHDLGSPDVASSSSNREDVPQFHGPTTAAFAFERARSSLRGSGLGGLTVTDEAAEIPSSESTASPWKPSFDHQSSSNTLEPALVEIGEAEILRLCHNYDNKFGLIYPVVDITALTSKFRTCFTQQRSGRSDPRVRFYNSADQILPHDIAVLKVVLATSLAVEGGGRSDQGRQLFESAQDSIQGLMWQPAGLWSIQLLTLAAICHLAQDAYAITHRLVAQAVTFCFEMGIHRADLLRQRLPDDKDITLASKIFWSLYMLDRRVAFGTGFPVRLQDAEIDTELSQPDISTPYFHIMLDYSRLSEKVIQLHRSKGTTRSASRREELGQLDYLVLRWQDRIPSNLKFSPLTFSSYEGPAPPDQVSVYHRAMLYLRGNQLRNVIYRGVLCTPQSIKDDQTDAQMVIDIAKDTIRVMSHLDRTTNIYRRQSCELNRYLIAAIGVLLLAAINATGSVHTPPFNEEYSTALDMLESTTTTQLGPSHHQSQKLKVLKELGPRLHLVPPPAPPPPTAVPRMGSSKSSAAAAEVPQHPALPNMPAIADIDLTSVGFSMTEDWLVGEDFLNLVTTGDNW